MLFLVKKDDIKEVLVWFGKMIKEGYEVDIYFYNILILCFCRRK